MKKENWRQDILIMNHESVQHQVNTSESLRLL
jgi:hypothetical protein